MSCVDGMRCATFEEIDAWRRDPGLWKEVEVPDGFVLEWSGGALCAMMIELVEELNRRGSWYRLPWTFRALGVIPGEGMILYLRDGVREL